MSRGPRLSRQLRLHLVCIVERSTQLQVRRIIYLLTTVVLTGTSCIMHVLLRLVQSVVRHLKVSHWENARLPIVGDPEALQVWK